MLALFAVALATDSSCIWLPALHVLFAGRSVTENPPHILPVLRSVRKLRVPRRLLTTSLCGRRAGQSHQAFDVHGRTGHRLLDKHFGDAPVAGTSSGVSVD
jgi:hypothetical protein